jgi:hypothetical protein
MHGGERKRAALDVVDDASGRPDYDLYSAFERHEVGLHAASADEPEGGESVEAPEVFDNVAHLLGEFACGDEHDRLDFVAVRVDRACQRQPEGDRLARAGLCEANDNVSVVEEYKRGRLNRRWLFIPERGDGIEANLIDIQRCKGSRMRREGFGQARLRSR